MARKLPLLNTDNAHFWQGGADGALRMHHCNACQLFFHPPAPVCPHCVSLETGPRKVSGRGKVVSFTVNYQPWLPDLEVPYVVAIVELVEQAGLRFLTNIVGCTPHEVAIEMPVRVTFQQIEDIWLPLFEKDA